jgi:hypothetical protein
MPRFLVSKNLLVSKDEDALAFQICQQQSDLSMHAALSIQAQRVRGDGIDGPAKNGGNVLLRVTTAKQIFYFQLAWRRLLGYGIRATRASGPSARRRIGFTGIEVNKFAMTHF